MSEDTRVKYGLSIQNNALLLQRLHDLSSLLFGTLAGILQLESLNGFLFFLSSYFLVNGVVVYVIRSSKVNNYFQSIWSDIICGNIGRSISSYIMMWCLIYALIDS